MVSTSVINPENGSEPSALFPFGVAHASRVLVSASRRNTLSLLQDAEKFATVGARCQTRETRASPSCASRLLYDRTIQRIRDSLRLLPAPAPASLVPMLTGKETRQVQRRYPIGAEDRKSTRLNSSHTV